jgi:transposase-like protein
MLRRNLPFNPEDAIIINDDLAVVFRDENIVFINGSGPINFCRKDDQKGLRIASAMFVSMKLARAEELSPILGYHRSSIFRNQKIFKSQGVSGFERTNKTGPKGGHKLKEEVLSRAQELLNEGKSVNATAKEIGIWESTIRNAISKGRLQRKKSDPVCKTKPREISSVRERSDVDKECIGGIGVKREGERVMAMRGLIEEAEPQFVASESVQNAGVLLALPELVNQGLLKIGIKVFEKLRGGFFGLRSILLTLCFMALLRIKTTEQLSKQIPGEMGLLLGLDRAPEVKTIRRKLKEIGDRRLATEFAVQLTKHWVKNKADTIGFLYVDGHVRAYTGRKHKLPKTHVARRRLCMPAVTDFWVNDEKSDPLFYVTTEANDSLLSVLKGKILPEVRSLVGADRRVTIIFDREGWSPKMFEEWCSIGFDVITYRKYKYEYWPEECFTDIKGEFFGKEMVYKLGFQFVEIKHGFWMKEVRRLCKDGHQTSIMTTRLDLPMKEIAPRMFYRWTQENFFRYMRREYGIDNLCAYAVENADPERLVPNPEVKEAKKELAKLRKNLDKFKSDYVQKAFPNLEGKGDIVNKIQKLTQKHEKVKMLIKNLPKRIPLKNLIEKNKIVRHERDRKIFTDNIKMIAYRAESSLFTMLEPFFIRHDEEGRKFLAALFKTFADIIPDEKKECLFIRFHSMATNRYNKTLRNLCNIINQRECCYPGTNLRLAFEGP